MSSHKFIVLSKSEKELLRENIMLIYSSNQPSYKLEEIYFFIENYKIPIKITGSNYNNKNDLGSYLFKAPYKFLVKGSFTDYDLFYENDVFNYYLDRITSYLDNNQPLN